MPTPATPMKTCRLWKSWAINNSFRKTTNQLRIMGQIKSPDALWRIQKAKLLLRFSHLNEEDFRYDYGKKDAMMTRLQALLGKSREELKTFLLNMWGSSRLNEEYTYWPCLGRLNSGPSACFSSIRSNSNRKEVRGGRAGFSSSRSFNTALALIWFSTRQINLTSATILHTPSFW